MKRLPVVLESAEFAHQIVEGFFACVPEGRVPQIVCKTYRLGEAFI